MTSSVMGVWISMMDPWVTPSQLIANHAHNTARLVRALWHWRLTATGSAVMWVG